MGPFLPDLKEQSRLKSLSIPLFYGNTEMNLICQYSTEMYQFNLAKDLKEHKKTFPLSLKFTTDLMSVTELFASGRLLVLLHVSKTVGLSNSRPLSLLTLKLCCIIQSMLLEMIILFKWITSLLSRRQTYSSWFFPEYIYCQGRNNASCYHSTLWAEIKLFQYLVLPLTSVVFDWPASIPSLCNNSLMFLGTSSPSFQSMWFNLT